MTAVETLWRDSDVSAATGGRASAPFEAGGVAIDSRTLKPGDIYFAIKGVSLDGHDFVAAAFKAGAAAAVVEPGRIADPAGPVVVVADALAALNDLGRAARKRSGARIAAVTGSVGKTGTKEALRTVLMAQSVTHASEGSLNNHWGAPLSLARMPLNVAFGIFELGMNHAGELTPLTRLVRPHVALITWIAPAHTEFFRTVAEIADAKGEIFRGVEPGGTAIVPHDSEFYARLRGHAESCGIGRVLSFGSNPGADARLLDADLGPLSSTVTADILGTKMRYRIGAAGKHWVANSLAVLATAASLGADLAKAAASMSDVQPPKGRGVRHRVALKGGAFELIDESYNASPEAVRAALETLALAVPGPGGRRIAILGDMRELGDTADVLHAGLAAPIDAAGVDLVMTCGPHMHALSRTLPASRRGPHAADSATLLPDAVNAVRPGDIVLVKGSLGTRMAPIVEALRAMGIAQADSSEQKKTAENNASRSH